MTVSNIFTVVQTIMMTERVAVSILCCWTSTEVSMQASYPQLCCASSVNTNTGPLAAESCQDC